MDIDIRLYKNKQEATYTDSLINSIDMLYLNLKDYKKQNEKYEVFNVKRVGRLLEGEAFCYEEDDNYSCIGFEVEYEYKHKNKGYWGTSVGFFSLWAGQRSNKSPLYFESSNAEFDRGTTFSNESGDMIGILRVRATKELVQYAIKQYVNIKKYGKRKH